MQGQQQAQQSLQQLQVQMTDLAVKVSQYLTTSLTNTCISHDDNDAQGP
jgi:hypothetical protein